MNYESIGNEEFYPTPPELIDKMLCKIDFRKIKNILEPEAGKGDIADAIIKRCKNNDKINIPIKNHIDTIEIDNNLVHILKGKGYRVVHNNFLTFNTQKRYSLIIMNPPFSSGDKHLLKALELQQYGGGIICILNSETIKNPYSNTRKDLVRKLTELNAEIEYLQNTFSHAENSTNVEIALIKVYIPLKKTKSYIYEKLKKEKRTEENEEVEYKELIESDYIKEIIDRYNIEIKAGIELINEYKAIKPLILKEISSEPKANVPVLKLCLDNSVNKKEVARNDYIRAIRGKYWRALFRHPKFIKNLTADLQREYYNMIERLKEYDFSLYNIYTLKIEMQQKVIKGMENTIFELFEEFSNKYSWLDETSKNIHYYDGWKTNKAWKINKKVIIPLSNNYDAIYKLSDAEKVLNYLDGNIEKKTSIEKALSDAKSNYQTKNIITKYFIITFYKKGTCHLVFRNLDLLHKFNIYGSKKKGWLPPSYGRAKYNEMTKEEQEVIDDFEGKESYEKTFANKNYYIHDQYTSLELLE